MIVQLDRDGEVIKRSQRSETQSQESAIEQNCYKASPRTTQKIMIQLSKILS